MDGHTTWKASDARPPYRTGSRSGSMTFSNSKTDPGQPCTSSSGSAPASGDLAWTAEIRCPSTSIATWPNEFSRASHARQSKPVRQYAHSSWRYCPLVPYDQPLPGNSSSHRVRASRSRRSSSSPCGTCTSNGVTLLATWPSPAGRGSAAPVAGRTAGLVEAEQGDTIVAGLQPVGAVRAQRHVDLLRAPLRDAEAERGQLARLERRPGLLRHGAGQQVWPGDERVGDAQRHLVPVGQVAALIEVDLRRDLLVDPGGAGVGEPQRLADPALVGPG